MKIITQNDFVEYIRMRLGYPVVNVELTNEQIYLIIDDVFPHEWDDAYEVKIKLEIKDECVNRAYTLWNFILNKYPSLFDKNKYDYNETM